MAATDMSRQEWLDRFCKSSIDEYNAVNALMLLKQARLDDNNKAQKKSRPQRGASKKSSSSKKISSPVPPSSSCYPVGTRIAKEFFLDKSMKKKMFGGFIFRYNSRTRTYSVLYDDGDQELISATEMGALVDKATKTYCSSKGCTTLARVGGTCYKHCRK